MRKHILFLASGSSRRFGENKLLFEKDGKPLFLWSLEMLHALAEGRKDCDLTVVSRYETIRQRAGQMGIFAVDSPESEQGISRTIQAGIFALGQVPEEDYLLFVVADQPRLRKRSVENLLALADSHVSCGSLCHEGRPGNPTLFSAALIPELLALEGDTGGRAVLKRHDCVFVPAEAEEELLDIDTKEDLS